MRATQSSSPHRFTANPRRPNQVRKSCRHPSRYRPTSSGPHAFTVVRQNRSAIAPLLAARTIRGVWNSRANSAREGNIRCISGRQQASTRVPTGHAGTDLACARSALVPTTLLKAWHTRTGDSASWANRQSAGPQEHLISSVRRAESVEHGLLQTTGNGYKRGSPASLIDASAGMAVISHGLHEYVHHA